MQHQGTLVIEPGDVLVVTRLESSRTRYHLRRLRSSLRGRPTEHVKVAASLESPKTVLKARTDKSLSSVPLIRKVVASPLDQGGKLELMYTCRCFAV